MYDTCPGCGEDLDYYAVVWLGWHHEYAPYTDMERYTREGFTACCGYKLVEYDY